MKMYKEAGNFGRISRCTTNTTKDCFFSVVLNSCGMRRGSGYFQNYITNQ